MMLRTALYSAIAASLAFCPMAANANKDNDTLIYSSNSEPENVSPYHNSLREGVILQRHVWDNLIYRNPETGKYEPLLATSWKWIDPTTIEFKIRKGVKFHNGDALTAEDVAFTFNYVLDPKSKIINKQHVAWMAGATKVDDYTVRLKLKKPFPAALEYLSSVNPIYPAAYFKKVGLEGYSQHPVGTGPYKIVKINSGDSVEMVKNDDYFKDSPKNTATIKHLTFKVIPDGETRIAELMTGGIDWTWRIPSDQADAMREMDGIKITSAETMRVGFVILDAHGNSEQGKPFADIRVRRAVNHAISRKAISEGLVRGGSRVINTPCYVSQVGCVVEKATVYDYNPEKAKKLLAEAGYPNGFETTIYGYRDRDYAEAIVGYLRAVGIKAKLQMQKYSILRTGLRKNEIPMAYYTWGSFSMNDASAFTSAYFSGGTDDSVKDPDVVKWLTKADKTVDEKERVALYGKAIAKITKEAYWAPLFSYSTNYAYTSDLSFKAYPDEMPRFYKAHWN